MEGAALAIDPGRCPLCSGPNGCAMEAQRLTGQPQPPCWCTRVAFSAPVLARVPSAAKDKACICPACAAQPGPSGPSVRSLLD